MVKNKVREVSIVEDRGTFNIFKKSKTSKEEFDFEGIKSLRQLLSNEKARILHVIKNEKPNSIYLLAKKLGRSFKSVNDDVKLLEKWGFIELYEEKTKKRIRYRPVIVVDTIIVHVKI